MKTLESFIYINSQQGNNSIGKAVDDITSLDGVIAANINKNIDGLMNVKHDPERITGGNIIEHLKTNGYSSYQFGF